MYKDFDKWNTQKKTIDRNVRNLQFKEGEIWWCSLGLNIGEEAYGKGDKFRRPVIVLKKLSHNSCIVMPTTTKEKFGSWYFAFTVKCLQRRIMMHQIKSISANRLDTKESEISNIDFLKLKKSLAKLLGLF